MDKKSALEKIAKQIKKCKKCRLFKSANKAVPGEGPANAKLLFIGAAPGKIENLSGRPFVGKAGQFFDYLLEKNKINRKKVFITSIIKHFPPKNRLPKADEIKACLPYVIKQINIIKPKLIVILGTTALKSLLNKNKLKLLHGKIIIQNHKKFFITYHPAAGMRFPKIDRRMKKDFKKLKEIKNKN